MTKQPPAFQFYAADFLGDTLDWENEELGMYLRLLIHEWINESLPIDTKRLAKIVSEPHEKFLKSWSEIISKKFTENGNDRLINKRLEETRRKQSEYRDRASRAGKIGGGNPNFKKGEPNPYIQKNKQKDKQPNKRPDKLKINSSSSSSSLSSTTSSKKEKNILPLIIDYRRTDNFWIPRAKKHWRSTPINREKFAESLRKLREIDGLKEDEIDSIQKFLAEPEIGTFVKEDNFWFDKIRTPIKLRKMSPKAECRYWELVLKEAQKKEKEPF